MDHLSNPEIKVVRLYLIYNQQLTDIEREMDALVASIKELRKHNKGAQRDFRRTMRARLKELRVARNAR